ncbi:MAG: leucine-rich repeat domain-containing protein [Bacteroidota bacterium]|nr:leucine-rich repeat domain-containing protein [Bacteroidota bacterium]
MKKIVFLLAMVMGFTLMTAISQVKPAGTNHVANPVEATTMLHFNVPASVGENYTDLAIEVPSAGSLSSILTTEQASAVVNLKITGFLNSTDLSYLKTYTPLLANLDISAVTYSSATLESEVFMSKSSLQRVWLPKQVTGISYNAFNGCLSLQRVFLPDSLRTLDSYAFQGCTKLDSVIFPSKLSNIGYYAFESCTALQTVSLPNGLTTLGNYAFRNCTKLKTVVLPDTLTTISYGLFSNCSALESVHLPLKLTAIYDYAFSNCAALDTIAFPIALTSIGQESFENCVALKSAVLPNNVSTLNSYAFYNCQSLERVVLPANLTTINYYTFNNCSSLKYLKLPENLTKIYGYAFQNCSKLDTLIFPSMITEIGAYAFIGCSSLKVAKLPNTLLIIRDGLFRDCVALDSVSYPVGLTQIGNYAFFGCNSLKGQLLLPATLTYVGYYAFLNSGYTSCKCLSTNPPSLNNASNSLGNIRIAFVPVDAVSAYENAWTEFLIIGGDTLTTVDVTLTNEGTLGETILQKVSYLKDVQKLIVTGPLNETDLSLIKNSLTSLVSLDLKLAQLLRIPDLQFDQKMWLLDIVLPDSLQAIGYQAFNGCKNLSVIKIPTKVTALLDNTFNACSNLYSVSLPEGLVSIGQSCFNNCTSLEQIQLPPSLEQLYNAAFYYCTKLKSLTIPPKVTFIGNYTFQNCTNLETVTFPEGLTTIGYEAFYECGLTSLRLPDKITSIESYAFYSNNIKKLVLPANLTHLSYGCFAHCPIDSLVLPTGLSTIEPEAFSGCTSLKDIRCLQPTPPVLTDDPFYQVDKSACSLSLPFWSANLYKMANIWSLFYPVYTFNQEIKEMPISGNLVFGDNIRPLGSPNVTLLTTGSLTVRGNAPMTSDQFSLDVQGSYWYGFQFSSGRLINECPNMTAGKVRVNLNFSGSTWYYLAFPFDVRIDSLSIDNNAQFVFRKYDGAVRAANGAGDSWKTMTKDSVLKAGEGYIYQCSTDAKLIVVPTEATQNQLFANTTSIQPLKEYASASLSNASWNFVGNPFPACFDISKTEFTAPITIWDYNNQTYEAISPLDDQYILKPFEAFFVQKPADPGLSQISYRPAGRQLTEAYTEIVPRVGLRSATDRQLINLSLSNDSYQDKCRVVINPAASLSYELETDASKFMSGQSKVPQLYTIDDSGIKYAINERPLESGIIRLGCYVGAEGTYTLAGTALTETGYQVLLTDKQLFTQTLLNEQNYQFSADKGFSDNRFELSIVKNATQLMSLTEVPTIVWAADGKLNVRTKAGNHISIVGLNGVLIEELDATEEHMQFPLNKGVYLVKVDGKTFKSVVFK